MKRSNDMPGPPAYNPAMEARPGPALTREGHVGSVVRIPWGQVGLMRRLVPCLAALGLLSGSCVVAPIAYHDGLPACTPAPGMAAARFEYNRAYWWHGNTRERPAEYICGGVRFGQDWRRFCFEEGLTVLYPGAFVPCLQGGVGLRDPAVTLRALWSPGWRLVADDIQFDLLRWWQVSTLVGTARRSRGFGFSGGARTSRIGIGPVAVLDYSLSGISFRLEGSMAFRPPWQDSTVQGRVLTVGLSAEPTKEIPHK